jgi:hypothetical protein
MGIYRYHGRHSPTVGPSSPPLSPFLQPAPVTDDLVNIQFSPDETLAMSYLYRNRYQRFQESESTPDPLDPYVRHSSWPPREHFPGKPHANLIAMTTQEPN